MQCDERSSSIRVIMLFWWSCEGWNHHFNELSEYSDLLNILIKATQEQ